MDRPKMARNLVIFLVNLIFIQNIIYVLGQNSNEAPEVISSLGRIRGVRATNGNYSMFLGVPFAKVNESNPFGPSLPAPRFDKVFEAFNADTPCPHTEEFNWTTIGSLDCLTLNIYKPDSASPENPVAVLLYIFGGRFVLGNANDYLLGPKFLMRHDVMLVKINYRLGPYGFFCLHTPEIPGNQGLRDQYDALKWVQEHIANFGGDPNKVTIFGNSAGASSVDYQVLAETEPLFSGVIMQSGTAHISQLSGSQPTQPIVIAEALGLNTTDVNEALAHIMTFDPITVIEVTETTSVSFNPCIEPEIPGVVRIISDNAVNINASKTQNLNVLIGSNDDEALYILTLLEPEMLQFMTNIFRGTLTGSFQFDDETLETAERMVRNFYIGDEDAGIDVMYEMGDFYSDTIFIYPTERTIKQYLNSGAKEIYYYFFTYSGGRNFMQLQTSSNERGAYHADEVGYLFDIGLVRDVEPTPEDQLIVDRMTTMWTNFAKYGNPTPETTELLPVKWEPITKGSVYHYLNITTDINTARRPFNQRMVFWDLFYEAYGEYERSRLRNADDEDYVDLGVDGVDIDVVDGVDVDGIDEVDVDNTNNSAFTILPSLLLTTLLGAVSRVVC